MRLSPASIGRQRNVRTPSPPRRGWPGVILRTSQTCSAGTAAPLIACTGLVVVQCHRDAEFRIGLAVSARGNTDRQFLMGRRLAP